MGWLARRRERRAALEAGFSDEWRSLLAQECDWWAGLDDDERGRLEDLTMGLLYGHRWETAAGVDLNDEVRLLVAAHAARLGIGLPGDPFRNVGTIVVLPDDLRMRGEYEYVDGIVTDDESWVSGLADPHGPLMISWDALCEDLDYPGDGRNVVYHEFAHQLERLDGVSDGVPPFASAADRDRWIVVATEAYEAAARGEGGESLDEYAGVNPVEFFAVATEAFFDAPGLLRDEHPELYEMLATFYGQDPALRKEARS